MVIRNHCHWKANTYAFELDIPGEIVNLSSWSSDVCDALPTAFEKTKDRCVWKNVGLEQKRFEKVLKHKFVIVPTIF